MTLRSAAWVPDDDPERDWSLAAAWAAQWVEERCREEQASGVLVTNAMDFLGVPELEDFEQRHARASRRAGRTRVGSGVGPVLSYVPHAEDLQFAMTIARDSSLAVVETVSFPVSGWAAWLGALNLVTGTPTPALPDSLRTTVDRLVCCGTNGFSDPFGKKQARSILSQVRSEVELRLLQGAMLAAGLSARAVTNLERLAAKPA